MLKNKLFTLVASTLVTLPLVAAPLHAEDDDSDIGGQSTSQAIGYIGDLSESVIQSGNLYRLEAGATYEDYYADGVDDLKARIKFWHNVALDTVALDHTPLSEGAAPALNQGGPTRTSRALAMVQIAVFDALNAIEEEYVSYTGIDDDDFEDASPHSAVAWAAFRTLKRLYPAQEDRLKAIRDEERARIRSFTDRDEFRAGRDLGKEAFRAIRDARRGDRSRRAEPDFGEGGAVADGKTTFFGTRVNGGTRSIGEWEPDPNTPPDAGEFNLALGAFWGQVTPFFMESGDQFRSPKPPLPSDDLYVEAYDEVTPLGGSPENVAPASTSTDETRFIGNFWGYDGVPLVGVPPRIYNQIAVNVAKKELDEPLELARLLALVNVVMADTAISIWDSKYFYNYWRPVTATRRDDANPNTDTFPTWSPVGVSVINTSNPVRPTPPFPAYPSGHAGFGGSMFEVLREFFGDDQEFVFVSDEYNGEGFDPFTPDTPRPFVPVYFENFTDAQVQNGRSRVFNGVHWFYDDEVGQDQGVAVARYLLDEVDAFQED